MSKLINLVGKRFNRLTVIKYMGKSKWLCKCDCGNETIVDSHNLRTNHTKSCGCYNKEKFKQRFTTHGLSTTRIYKIYLGIKKRCYNKNYREFHLYGGRGIKVCQEWLDDFMSFYIWSGANGYKDDLTIDRIDVNGNYESTNCRWITQAEQNLNTRKNHYITYNGITMSMKQWAEKCNLSYSTLQHRIYRNWNVEKALLTPQRIIGNLK